MKKTFFKMTALMAVTVLSSCSSSTYYQLVNTKPVGELKKTDNAVVFEDDNCKISYDLWTKGGSTLVAFENKTNEDIYLDLAATFYFMNNRAYDLYNGATTSNSTTTSHGGSVYWGYGITTGKNVTSNSTIVTQQHQIVTIPAKMYKVIGETDVTILGELYRDCNLFLAPSRKNVTSTSFSQNDSPYTFGLRLTYYVGQNKTPIKVKNEFYVNKFTNYPKRLFMETYSDKNYGCPDERVQPKQVSKYNFLAPDAFYLEYNPSMLKGGTGAGRKH